MIIFWLIVFIVGAASIISLAPAILSSRISRRDPFEE